MPVFFFGFPGVAVVSAVNVVVPSFTVGSGSIIGLFEFVEEDTVSAGSTFGDIFGEGWAIVFGKLSGFGSM